MDVIGMRVVQGAKRIDTTVGREFMEQDEGTVFGSDGDLRNKATILYCRCLDRLLTRTFMMMTMRARQEDGDE